MQALPQRDPAGWGALTAAVIAAYYMNEVVRAKVGYAGQQAIPFDPDAPPDYLEDGLLDSVKAPAAGVSSDPLTFRLADPDERYAAVRLCSRPAALRRASAASTRADGEWVLRIAAAAARPGSSTSSSSSTPTAARDGRSTPATRCARRARSARSRSLLLPGYEPPAWLDADGVDGRVDASSPPRGRGLGANVAVAIWSPADARASSRCRCWSPTTGPSTTSSPASRDYSARAMIAAGALPPHRVALVAPGAPRRVVLGLARCTRARWRRVLPALATRSPCGDRSAMGASLGALAMLHAQRRAAARSPALFLQSGSFFMPRFDAQESRLPALPPDRARRAASCTRDGRAEPVPVALTCGAAEENIDNNRVMARALAEQGYDAELHEVRDMHNYTGLARRAAPAPDAPAAGCGMSGRHAELYSPAIGAAGNVVAYGHWGRPVLAFPAEGGSAWDFENHGIIDALAACSKPAGAKLYCVDAYDGASWSNRSLPLEERARRTSATSRGSSTRSCRPSTATAAARRRSLTTGAAWAPSTRSNFALRRADLFPLALGMSGNYDPSTGTAGASAASRLLQQPDGLRAHLDGDHLDWLRSRVSLLLVCGQGMWEDTTGALESTQAARRAARREGHPARAGPVGPRRPARLAVLARADRPSSAALLLMADDATHLIGLLLGTEDDWPTAFETLVARLGPIKDAPGTTHASTIERITIEPFDLRDKPRYDLVIDRLAYWYYLPREWLKKVALMDDVYLLNSPFTFQSMEKHAAYCAMMRLGLKVPQTVLVPYKNPPDNASFAYTAAQVQPAVRPRRDRRRASATRCS